MQLTNHVEKKARNSFLQKIAVIIATGLGTGYMPKAPGTWGSFLGIPVSYIINHFSNGVAFGLLGLLIALAVWSANRAINHFGNQDPGQVVVDEIAGMAFSLFAIPMDLSKIIGAFLLFRTLDIVKPFPIKQIESRFHGGLGIVIDDLAAGVGANIILQIAMRALNVW